MLGGIFFCSCFDAVQGCNQAVLAAPHVWWDGGTSSVGVRILLAYYDLGAGLGVL